MAQKTSAVKNLSNSIPGIKSNRCGGKRESLKINFSATLAPFN